MRATLTKAITLPAERASVVQFIVTLHDDWLWGWDPTPGIVSVWADGDGRATIWRRLTDTDTLVRETAQFRPWLLLSSLDDLAHLGNLLSVDAADADARTTTDIRYRELHGPGALRYLVSAGRWDTLTSAILTGASKRRGRRM